MNILQNKQCKHVFSMFCLRKSSSILGNILVSKALATSSFDLYICVVCLQNDRVYVESMHCYVKGLLFVDQYMHSQYFHVLNSKHSECGIPITTSKVCILISKMKCVALISYLRYTLCLHWQFFEHCVMCNLVIFLFV